MLTHINLEYNALGLSKRTTLDLGGFGVTIFFSLSGFLITYLLLQEKKRTNNINIAFFYLRRIFRIWPLYYVYLIIGISILFWQNYNFDATVIYYFLLTANIPFILGCGLPHVSHLWSVSVEEQFYLFWPWLIKKFKSPFKVFLILWLFFFAMRLLFRILEMKYNYSIPYIALQVNRFDCMIIGALGAVMFYQNWSLFLHFAKNKFIQLLSWSPLLLLSINKFHIFSIIDHELISICVVIIIINISTNKSSIIKLDNKIFHFLGTISYGIYVWHPLVILFLSKKLITKNLTSLQNEVLTYFTVLALSIIIAWVSYNYLEKPFLRIKEKYNA